MTASILVIDDEKFIIEAISQLLEETGHDVIGKVDASEALQLIKERDFDLVLTDLRMPEVTGMDISRAVQAKGSDTLVIILTGYATLDTAIESISLDVYAYLSKPFDLTELGQVVNRALTAQGLKRENKALNASISQMLDDVSTLYEVTRFLYDTDDWDITMEFILDTLSIGLGLTHSCLVLRNDDTKYESVKGNYPAGSGLADVVADFDWDTLEGLVSTDEPTLVGRDEKSRSIFEPLSTTDEPLQAILFIPIRYRERLVGFLVVFLIEGSEPVSDDKRRLLQILALQIAPQVFQAQGEQALEWRAGRVLYTGLEQTLKLLTAAARDDGSLLGISLLRFHTSRTMDTPDELGEFHEQCAKMVRVHDPEGDLHWIGADTALAFFPGSNQVQSEITCMAMADDFRKAELGQVQDENAAALYSASKTWPRSDADAVAFLTALWAQLSNQIYAGSMAQMVAKAKDG